MVDAPLKLDLGSGPNKREGFLGIDSRPFDGKVDQVVDLVKLKPGVEPWRILMVPSSDGRDLFEPWPWADDSVDEIHCSHFIEHLNAAQRVFFANEMWRVLKAGAKATLIAPHCLSERAYGDMTHVWPPFAAFWFYYLDKGWRAVNAPHNDFYVCDFAVGWGNNLHPVLGPRNQDFQQFAALFFKEAIQDLVCTFTARKGAD